MVAIVITICHLAISYFACIWHLIARISVQLIVVVIIAVVVVVIIVAVALPQFSIKIYELNGKWKPPSTPICDFSARYPCFPLRA